MNLSFFKISTNMIIIEHWSRSKFGDWLRKIFIASSPVYNCGRAHTRQISNLIDSDNFVLIIHIKCEYSTQ